MVASYLLSVVGTLYAVTLGLIVVDSLGKFAEARMTTEGESNALADLILILGPTARPTGKRPSIGTPWPT